MLTTLAALTLAFAQVRSYAAIGLIAFALTLATLHAYVLGRSRRMDFTLHSVMIGLEFSIAIAAGSSITTDPPVSTASPRTCGCCRDPG